MRRAGWWGPWVWALLATLAAATSACAEGENPALDVPSAVYRVGIDIPFHPLFAYVDARSEDYFAGSAYTVRFDVLDTSTLLPAFGDREIDVIATFPSFLPRIEERYGIVAQQFQPLARILHGMAVWVPETSTAQTLEDLRGARVAVPPLGQQWGEDEAMVVAATGETIHELFELSESAAPVQQLLQGRVDAAFVGTEAEPILRDEGGFRPLVRSDEIFAEAYGDPLVLSGGLIAPKTFIDDHPELIADLRAAFTDAWDRWARDPEAVISVASEHSDIPPDQLRAFGEAVGLSAPQARRSIDARDVATWERLFEALARSGFLDRAPADPSIYFRPS